MMENAFEVLLVEDDPQDAELTLRALRAKGLANKIHRVGDGAEALDFIFATGSYSEREVGHGPKLVLLDLRLPRVDGIEVLRQIKADERTRKIPVVVMTSSREEPDVARCYELGANSYIVKPVGFENFTEAVANLGVYWLMLNESPV